MALIPNRMVRISMAYKLSVIIAFALGFCCFFWDLYTHDLLEETQEQLRKSLENQETLLRFVEIELLDKRCRE
jgi:hypothetical protein